MPDRRKSGLTKPTLVALVVVVAGALAITVALLSGSSSPNSGNPGKNREVGAIKPVEPIDPNDKDAGSAKKIDPLDSKSDPFAASFGEKAKHEVVVRVTADGPGGVSIRYNDGRDKRTSFTGSYSSTRTFSSRFPTVGVVMQIIPPSSTGSCTVTVDGKRVSNHTTNEQWGVLTCGG
jgi:hypothetical protein